MQYIIAALVTLSSTGVLEFFSTRASPVFAGGVITGIVASALIDWALGWNRRRG